MKKLGIINPRKVIDEDVLKYKLREAVRVIVFDSDKKLLYLKFLEIFILNYLAVVLKKVRTLRPL